MLQAEDEEAVDIKGMRDEHKRHGCGIMRQSQVARCRDGQYLHFCRGSNTILVPAGVCGFGGSLGRKSMITKKTMGLGWWLNTSAVDSWATEIQEGPELHKFM